MSTKIKYAKNLTLKENVKERTKTYFHIEYNSVEPYEQKKKKKKSALHK
jgi:hypothetical protein